MGKIKTIIFINVNSGELSEILMDISNYHTVFPFYEKARSIDKEHWEMRTHMKLGLFSKRGKTFSWVSCIISRNKYTLICREIDPHYLLTQMLGFWTIKKRDKGSCLSLLHKFEVHNRNVIYSIIASTIVYLNSKKLLKALKYHLENEKRKIH